MLLKDGEKMKRVIFQGIIDTGKDGITIESPDGKVFINFNECAKNFSSEHGDSSAKCVATRDITSMTFIFYTAPKTEIVFEKRSLKSFFRQKSVKDKFSEMQKAIDEAGYRSYDLS